MKKILFSLLLLSSLSILKTQAQMGAAKTMTWDVNKDATINMEADAVWEIFNSVELQKKVSNGYVTGIETIDANAPVVRKITFSNGSSRVEVITQNQPEHRMQVFKTDDSNLPKGIKSTQFAMFIKAKGNQTAIQWRAIVEGDKEAKKALMDSFTAEFESYIAGLTKMAEQVVPAAKLN